MKPIAIASFLPALLGAAALGLPAAHADEAPATAAPADAAPTASAAPRSLTFQGAIELALGHSPEVAMAKEVVAAAEARTAGLSARRLPSLRVEAGANLFREAYELPFGEAVVTLHEQTTTTASVTISQPLTKLAYLTELVGAARHDAAASRGEYDRARLDLAYKTAEAYLRVLSAQAQREVAHRSVSDLQQELDRAITFRKAESTTDIDVLRFRSAKAAADQAALRADAAAQVAEAGLVTLLGLPEGTPLALADDLPSAPPALSQSLEDAQRRALSTRPELVSAREQIAAADKARRAARTDYLPDVRAFATYEHLTGTQPFQPEHEELVGVRLSWNVWDWGATHQAVLEAEHKKTRAELAQSGLIDQVRFDVRRRFTEAKTLFASLSSAALQQETADEAYRLQKVRFEAAAATATDVLDAETDSARARLGAALARYDYYLSLVALARSVGDLPSVK